MHKLTLVAVILSFIFLLLALLHFYWAVGGRWAMDVVVPKNKEGIPEFSPGFFLSGLVGFALLSISLFYAREAHLWHIDLPPLVDQIIRIGVPAVFLLRAIGDFKVAGIFKKEKETAFGKADTKYFTPLCLVIAALGFGVWIF